jgi:hypothetical protein
MVGSFTKLSEDSGGMAVYERHQFDLTSFLMIISLVYTKRINPWYLSLQATADAQQAAEQILLYAGHPICSRGYLDT